MRIERIRVDGFGRLADFDTGVEPLGQLVVVLGPNEAGKSTLFSFLTTALYGFSPASRDTNPHVPWGTNEAGGSIHIQSAAGECLVVERRLRSAPAGTLVHGEQQLDLRNQPLEGVRHVPRTVFRQVFAVTLAELAGLDDETWGRIQDRVLGSMGASDLASARDVAERLEREAGEIWRPTRRGNQRLRDLRDGMRSLRSRRTEAMARDRDIRALMEERESVALRLDDVRRDLKRDRIVVERVQDLLPLKRQLDRVAALRREGGPRAELDGLPNDLVAELESLEDEVTRLHGRLSAVDDDLTSPVRTMEAFGDADRRVLGRSDEVEAFLRSPDSSRSLATRLDEVTTEAEHVRVEVEATERQLFEAPPTDDVRSRLSELSTDLLRDRVERLQGMRRHAGHGTGPHRSSSQPGVWPRWIAGAAVVLGGALLAWGLLTPSPIATAIGAGLLAGGLFFARMHPADAATQGTADGHADGLESEVTSLLADLGVRAEYMDPVGLPVVVVVERLQEQWAREQGVARSKDTLDARLRRRHAEAVDLAGALGMSEPVDLAAFEATIEAALRDARSRRDAADQASGEEERLRRARETIAADADRLERRHGSLIAQIATLGQGTSQGGLDAAQRRLDAHERADRIEEELERTHPDLVDRKARIADVDDSDAVWTVSEHEVTERRIRIEEAETHLEELVGRMRALERDVAHLREQETVDAIDGELESLREAEARMVSDRDRKWVLAQLVRQADQRFRDEHQPDLLQRASAYLRRLTNGRYERLLVDERGDGDLFHLVGPALPRPVPLASPISTGTLEQAYLALRLAIVDHLDRDRERLPLFIDEAFVNWDAARRDQGLSVLAEVSAHRQVFAFTCHPEMAERLAARGGRLVRLDR